MRSQKLLEKLMSLDKIEDIKIYRLSERTTDPIRSQSVDWNEPNVQAGFNSFLKEMYENNVKYLKSNQIFL